MKLTMVTTAENMTDEGRAKTAVKKTFCVRCAMQYCVQVRVKDSQIERR